MTGEYFIEDDGCDRCLVVTGKWSDAAESLVISGEIQNVTLSYVEGFDESSLDFLSGLPIRRLFVMARWFENVAGIESLGDTLTRLYLDVSPNARLDLAKLPLVEELAVSWNIFSKNRDFVDLAKWKRLRIEGWQDGDLSLLAATGGVEELYLWNRSRLSSLTGIEQWDSLRELSVYAPQLHDISALGSKSLQTIRKLDLEGCKKFDRLNPLGNLANLYELNIGDIGPVESFAPIAELSRLHTLLAYESTNVLDGDLMPLLNLTQLRELRLVNRRHYRPSVDEIETRLGIVE